LQTFFSGSFVDGLSSGFEGSLVGGLAGSLASAFVHSFAGSLVGGLIVGLTVGFAGTLLDYFISGSAGGLWIVLWAVYQVILWVE
jgi:hypothetical protein